MSKFKLAQTAAEVQNILNNSLQKPTGLTKQNLLALALMDKKTLKSATILR